MLCLHMKIYDTKYKFNKNFFNNIKTAHFSYLNPLKNSASILIKNKHTNPN